MPTTPVVLDADDATFDTSLGHWASIGGGTAPTQQTINGGVTPHAGSGMLVIHGVGSGAWLNYYTIPANHIYLVRAWAYGRSEPNGPWRMVRMGIAGGGASIASNLIQPTWPTSDQWVELVVSGASGPAGSLLDLVVVTSADYLTGNDGLFSDVSVEHEALLTPTGLTAVATSPTAVQLTWTHPAQAINASIPNDAVLGPRGHLERSADGGASWVDRGPSRVSPFNDTDLTPGTTYLYRLRARLENSAAGLPGYTDTYWTTGYAYQEHLPTDKIIESPNTATVSVTPGAVGGGWGVGMVRMGAN